MCETKRYIGVQAHQEQPIAILYVSFPHVLRLFLFFLVRYVGGTPSQRVGEPIWEDENSVAGERYCKDSEGLRALHFRCFYDYMGMERREGLAAVESAKNTAKLGGSNYDSRKLPKTPTQLSSPLADLYDHAGFRRVIAANRRALFLLSNDFRHVLQS